MIINASVESVWAKLITATGWPTWYSNASDVVVNHSSGQLGQDVTFNWTTFGLKIASKISEFVPHPRLGWYGVGDQLRASTPGCSSPGRPIAPTLSWKKSVWATEHIT